MQLRENTLLQGGRYRIIRCLGKGGFGITYLAEDTRFGETVAIKEFFIRQFCNRDEDTLHVSVGVKAMKETVKEFYDKFFREAQKTRKLKHRNIIKITDLFPENGTAYYVMDYHPGGSLGSLIRKQGALNEEQALRYIRQVASALKLIHSNNMAHLDIKPDNILLDDEDNAIVIDFGISKHYDEKGNATTIIPGANAPYTPGYAADSQMDGDKVCLFSPTLDIYSLGATLYNLVTGKEPPISAVIINYGFPALPDRISSSTCNAIKKAMEPKSANRPQSVDEFLSVLGAPAAGSRATELMNKKQLKCDILFEVAARDIVEQQSGSQSLLQRKYYIGYNRATRIMDQLSEAGIVGEYNGGKPREVLCHSIEELESLLKNFILIREEQSPPLSSSPSPKKPFNWKLLVGIIAAILCVIFAGVGINECNDYRAEQRRLDAIEKARQDSVAAVKHYNDSIAMVKRYNDSVNNALVIKALEQQRLAAMEKAHQDSIAVADKKRNTFERKTFSVNGIEFKMVAVAGGTFNMGSNDNDSFILEQIIHSVTLSDYYIGETEVTQELWEAVMDSNPSYFKGDKYPVERVSYNDCIDFINKLNILLAGQLPDGRKFRLPTEAQWEFAARGGNRSKGYKYSGSNNIGEVAWYGYDTGNSNKRTHPVKQKQPNELGLYDMTGNVGEWCRDWYGGYYSSSSQTNPKGPSRGQFRIIRGGSYYEDARGCRVAHRIHNTPDSRYINYGLRLGID